MNCAVENTDFRLAVSLLLCLDTVEMYTQDRLTSSLFLPFCKSVFLLRDFCLATVGLLRCNCGTFTM
jgi:hypothetical protein